MTVSLADIVAVHQLEPLARELMRPDAWEYVSGGAGDENTLRDNVAAWSRIPLWPHVLRDVSAVSTQVSLLGLDLAHPILLAPTARHAHYHPGGEPETMRGAVLSQSCYVQSSLSTTDLPPIAEAAGTHPWWFQLYIQYDRAFTEDLVARVVEMGARAIVVTVDTPLLGARDRDRRDQLGATRGVAYPILAGAQPAPAQELPRHQRVYNPMLAANLTWSDLAWLCEISPVPVIAKGILRPDDALRAIGAGVAGIAVSNHGARNLDTVPATAEVLPLITRAVKGRVPIIVDGGIRRGTDVAKAICHGANAVMVGRPYIWGLTCAGAEGVNHCVEILRTELHMAMALLGATDLSELTRDLVETPDQT